MLEKICNDAFSTIAGSGEDKISTVQYLVLDEMVQNFLLKRSEVSVNASVGNVRLKGPILSIQSYSI